MQLKNKMAQEFHSIHQHSMSQDTLCDKFKTPHGISKELLVMFGMNERELKQSMEKIGFVKQHRMYNNIYYQTLAVVYLIGLDKDDELIRKASILLMEIQIWNGRWIRRFPQYCDPDIMRYVINYSLKGNHTLKKSGTAYNYLANFSAPAIDLKYSKTIPSNLDSHTEGLRKLVDTAYSRIAQIFTSVAEHYYRLYKSGTKEIISGQYQNQYGEGDMVEARESFSGNIERIIDKMQKNAMLKRNILTAPASKKILKDKWNMGDAAIKKMNDWFEDDDNEEEIKYFFELVFTKLKPQNETDVCKFEVNKLSELVTGARKDPQLLKAKEILEHMIMAIAGDNYNRVGIQSKYKMRNFASYGFMIYAKTLLCKKPD